LRNPVGRTSEGNSNRGEKGEKREEKEEGKTKEIKRQPHTNSFWNWGLDQNNPSQDSRKGSQRKSGKGKIWMQNPRCEPFQAYSPIKSHRFSGGKSLEEPQ